MLYEPTIRLKEIYILNPNCCPCRSAGFGLALEDEQGNKLPKMTGYPTSKLLNVMHARELARRLKGKKIYYSCIAVLQKPEKLKSKHNLIKKEVSPLVATIWFFFFFIHLRVYIRQSIHSLSFRWLSKPQVPSAQGSKVKVKGQLPRALVE